ncbi:hypothetical protein PS838_01318 [Pseudomonas fluorescens]|nr:hypothetical protein PS838_01318 [Pseudomonas fluorescens]
MSSIGYLWLSHEYRIFPVQPFPISSEIGSRRSSTQLGDLRNEIYPEVYRPKPNMSDHLAFALRYEGVHLEFLARLYALETVKEALEEWITREPVGIFARRACFLYEWLMPDELSVAPTRTGNYVDALNPKDYLVGTAVNNPRWRVRNNLPGNRAFCPMIRRNEAVRNAERYDIASKLGELESDFGIDLIMRSTVWLTVKESRASFLIEHEQDEEDRIRRFANVMETECGTHSDPLEPDTLEGLQREILGKTALRYGIRRSPVYVGHTARYQPVIDYIAPHWDHTRSMLTGLSQFLQNTQSQSSILRAAVASFGFVYIHPMADGNGRISRFLINDVLRRDGVVPPPVILPVSATITHSTQNKAAYDRVLESFSRPLMKHYAAQYRFGETVEAEDGVHYNLHFTGYDDALPTWRYPDLTAHAVYLAQVIDDALTQEMRLEAQFLWANDTARRSIKQFLEAPDNELDQIIRAVRQNGHTLSNKLLKRYPLFVERPELGERLTRAVEEAFSELK